jgi:hypothetical protein
VYPIILKNFISFDVSCSYSFVWGSKFCFHIEEWVQPGHYIFIFEDFWAKDGWNVLFRIPSIWENFASICWNLFHFQVHFTTEIFKILHNYYPQWYYILMVLVLKMPSSKLFLVIFTFQNLVLYFAM